METWISIFIPHAPQVLIFVKWLFYVVVRKQISNTMALVQVILADCGYNCLAPLNNIVELQPLAYT